MSVPRLSEVIAALDALWPPERAEGWDAVGTVCGEPDAEVRRVLFAVDPVQEIADEAVKLGADLIVTHHPLYLRGTTTVAAYHFKGRVVHTLIKHDIALHVAHTNADTADPGVSDALAGALDIRVVRPLVPDATDPSGRRGLGRICELDHPMTLGEFAARAAARLPATAQGIRVMRRHRSPGEDRRGQRRLGRRPLRRRTGVGSRCLPHRRPAPPPGVGGDPARVCGPDRRRPLGHRVALVRAGRRTARRDFRPSRLGPAGPRLEDGHRPLVIPPLFWSPQLNAAPADQIRLLDVQALDVRLSQLAHKRKSLPEHAEIDSLNKDLAQLRDLLVAAQTEESDTAREQTKAEQDVDQVRQRAARDQQRLDSGAVSSPKDLESLQREIVSSPSARATWRTWSWRSWSAVSPPRSARPS